MTMFIKMLKDRSGSSAAEYALILAIVGSALALAAVALGQTIGNSINKTDTCLKTQGASCS
jgi:pilus assembly protein Flp/PilA